MSPFAFAYGNANTSTLYYHNTPATSPVAVTNKRKRGRPPKKPPIDSQTMTTTPFVSVQSSMPQQMSHYSFQFESNPDTFETPNRKKRKSSSSTGISPLDSSPPYPLLEQDANALCIDFGHEPQPTSLHSDPITKLDGSHVDPSLIFSTTQANNNLSLAPPLASSSTSSSSFPSPKLMSPATPKTFGSIVSSSPLYPRYSIYQDDHQQVQTPAPTPKRANSNASCRKAICERRNSHNPGLSLARSHSMRRLSTAPLATGPLSAPIRSSAMQRSHSLKRRVSLNICDGRAVVECGDDIGEFESVGMARTQTEPSTRHSQSVYDKQNDYLNDNARRMSLESLFPELSPAPVQHERMESAPLATNEDFDEDNEKDDARDALKKALDHRSSIDLDLDLDFAMPIY